MGRSHVIYSSLQIYEAAQELPSNIFFCLGWLEQKQISAYISQYQHYICCLMAYKVRKLAVLSI